MSSYFEYAHDAAMHIRMTAGKLEAMTMTVVREPKDEKRLRRAMRMIENAQHEIAPILERLGVSEHV